jgi:peptidyl-prolyl cis-trans isomerase A (cyclophilin A)
MLKKLLMPFLLMNLLASVSLAMGGAPKMPEKLYATFKTSKGDIVCQLYTKEAPKTVENFVGLATGKKEWTHPETKEKITLPLYSGTIFHRVIPDFMIQGGDPLGIGIGGPGYRFEDEFDPGLGFNRPGRLAMANSGPNTNGSQFFITVAPTTWLNNKHTIFGQVLKGLEIVEAISLVKRDSNDKPLEPVVVKEIIIGETI